MKWDKFSLIGHSYGAGLGAAYSGLYPKEVERLVLLDFTKIVTSPDDHNYPQHLASGFDFFLDMEAKAEREETPLYTYTDAVARLIRGTKNQINEESAKIFMIRGASRVDNQDKWQFNRDLLVNAIRVFRFTHESIFQIHGQIRCPVLLLQPTDGMVMETKEVLDKCLKIYQESSSNFQIIETGQGHFFHLNEPEEPAKFINKFFLES
ncbi:unnamed protein product [Allacma fusca]|uniref:AB hydrolase-1 domain-containing protein n=2 Tax=Allacma fusca TaxID=39272 RepID=A0A8J2MAL8_9HEXA|nr:unnamed protein product [Allacma fusca]